MMKCEVEVHTSFFRLNKKPAELVLQWFFLICGLFLTFTLAFKLRLPDLNWQIALSGWSAIDWVAHLNFPDRYSLDFSNGMGLYDKSSSMLIYPLVNRWFDVPVEQVIPVVIFLEMSFLAGACIFFARSLSSAGSPLAVILFALLVVLSPARNLDLSHFGAPFFWGLFYNFADGFRLLGLAFFLRRKPLVGALMLSIGFSIHPIITLFGCTFVAGFIAVSRNWITPKALALAILAFVAMSGSWFFYLYELSSIVSTQVDAQTWTRMARVFSFHFFPIDYGLLTLDFHQRLLPLLVLCLLAVHYLPQVVLDSDLRRGLIGGSSVLIALIVAGMLISLYLPIPMLVKLALPRASALLVLVALAISCIGLARDIQSGTVLQKLLGLLIVVSPFIYPPGFPLIPVAMLIFLSRRQCGVNKAAKHQKVVIGFLAIVLTVVFAYWWADLVQRQNLSSYTGYFALFMHWEIVAASGLLLISLPFILSPWRRRAQSEILLKDTVAHLSAGVVFLLACYLSLSWQKSSVPTPHDRAHGKSYLDAQLWARNNTPEQSLFMVDPTIYYGWRDFSERSSFGNLREWLHTSWLYDSRIDRYRAGLQRFGEFGIPLAPYLDLPVAHLAGYNKLHADIRKRFYEMDEGLFSSMRQRYSVSYVVMQKDQMVQSYSFNKIFENQHYVVFDLAVR